MSLSPALMPACCYPRRRAGMAEVLYCTYNRGGPREVAGRNFRGEVCSAWKDLPPTVQKKWERVELELRRAGLPFVAYPLDRLWTDAPISGVRTPSQVDVLHLDGDNVVIQLRLGETLTIPADTLHLHRPTR